MPSRAVILPMHVSGSSGNSFFHASSSGTASRLATVKSNSKSSPSVSAASNGGLAGELRARGQFRRAADGDGRGQQLRADATGLQQVTQVARQAVAQINHGVQRKVLRQPARFRQARLEIEMLAGQRTAEFAGDEDRVAGFRAGAQHAFAPRHEAQQRDGNQECARDWSWSRRRRSRRRACAPGAFMPA